MSLSFPWYCLCDWLFLFLFVLIVTSRMPLQSFEGLSGYLLAILFENRSPWLGIFVFTFIGYVNEAFGESKIYVILTIS